MAEYWQKRPGPDHKNFGPERPGPDQLKFGPDPAQSTKICGPERPGPICQAWDLQPGRWKATNPYMRDFIYSICFSIAFNFGNFWKYSRLFKILKILKRNTTENTVFRYLIIYLKVFSNSTYRGMISILIVNL